MKKVILLALCCLAYVSVQAQSVTTDQIKKTVEKQVQTITSKVDFSETQKTILVELLTYTAKEKAGNFAKYLKANPLRDINMDTTFTKEQRLIIKETSSKTVKSSLESMTPIDSTTKF
ncbi:MAG: hypothetical protein ACI9Y7_002457 [Dokdonia sp.]|jgi:hypothetical protein